MTDAEWKVLRTAIQQENFEDVVQSCDKLLAVLPKDADLLHTKCTALLQLSQFADALALLRYSAAAHDASRSIVPHRRVPHRCVLRYALHPASSSAVAWLGS